MSTVLFVCHRFLYALLNAVWLIRFICLCDLCTHLCDCVGFISFFPQPFHIDAHFSISGRGGEGHTKNLPHSAISRPLTAISPLCTESKSALEQERGSGVEAADRCSPTNSWLLSCRRTCASAGASRKRSGSWSTCSEASCTPRSART